MAQLIYASITTLDGYTADEQGRFEWGMPDDEVHSFINDQERAIGTALYGRRMYEVMRFWESPDLTGANDIFRDYAQIWQAADKIVYSRTLPEVTTERTVLKREFEADDVRKLKDSADRNISIGGPEIAAVALRAGLVDEVQLFICPVSIGGGTKCLPLGVDLSLELLDQKGFANGMVNVRYGVR